MLKLNALFVRLVHEEDGAVSVDWVVLCAAVVAIGVAVTTAMKGQLETAAKNLGAEMGTVADGTAGN